MKSSKDGKGRSGPCLSPEVIGLALWGQFFSHQKPLSLYTEKGTVLLSGLPSCQPQATRGMCGHVHVCVFACVCKVICVYEHVGGLRVCNSVWECICVPLSFSFKLWGQPKNKGKERHLLYPEIALVSKPPVSGVLCPADSVCTLCISEFHSLRYMTDKHDPKKFQGGNQK